MLFLVGKEPSCNGNPGNGFGGEIFGFGLEAAPVTEDDVISAVSGSKAQRARITFGIEALVVVSLRSSARGRNAGESGHAEMLFQLTDHGGIGNQSAGLDQKN